MKIKPIKSEKDYNKTLKRIEQLWGCKKNTSEGDEFEILITLVEKYEENHYPVPPPDPVEAIKFRMEQMRLTKKDLVKYLGHSSRVTEVLNRKRNLSIEMIRKLNSGLGIPAEVLIQVPSHNRKTA